jgi:DNA polymerase-4
MGENLAVKTILHLDMDAFYASVEQLDRAELRGRPVIVGGHGMRGVVCACSYEARTFGVHSAMPIARALRLCPHATVLPVRMARYQEISGQVFEIFERYTDLIEPISVDEAFLDVTDSKRLFGCGWDIATKIRRDVRDELGLAISVGIAPNKFLAKLASEQAKPDGIFQVPEAMDDFLLPLPLKRLWGVGPVMLQELEALGLRTVGDLRTMDRSFLEGRLGQAGAMLFRLARGEDTRQVIPERELKSIGHEDTFDKDLWQSESMHVVLLDLAERVATRLRRHGVMGTTLTLKVKYADFSTVTRSRTVVDGIANAGDMFVLAKELLDKTEAGRKPVRLLGISLNNLQEAGSGQGLLFDGQRQRQLNDLDRAVDRLRERYGEKGICRATLVGHRQRGLSED